MAAERVPAEPREQVVEDLLADPPGPPRRQLQAVAVARQVAGLLEPAGEVVERVEVAHRVVAEQVADVAPVDRRQVARGADVASWSSSVSSAWSRPSCSSAPSSPSGWSPSNR